MHCPSSITFRMFSSASMFAVSCTIFMTRSIRLTGMSHVMPMHPSAMLTVWLKCTTTPPTWDILTKALESPPVEGRLLAQQLREKYCQRTEERVTYSYPGDKCYHMELGELSEPQRQSTSRKVNTLHRTFCYCIWVDARLSLSPRWKSYLVCGLLPEHVQ